MNNNIEIECRGFNLITRGEKYGDWNVIEEVIQGDCYEIANMQNAEPVKTIVDVGAHIGCFSMMAYKRFPDATVYSFEPNKRSFELLRINAPFALAFNGAVYYSDAPILLTDGEGATGGGFVAEKEVTDALMAENQKTDSFIYTVMQDTIEKITIEKIIADNAIEQIDLLKLDCEGSEMNIFRNISKEAANKVRRIVGEYHLCMTSDGVGCASWSEFKALGEATFPHLTFHPRRIAAIELFYTTNKQKIR